MSCLASLSRDPLNNLVILPFMTNYIRCVINAFEPEIL